MRTLTFKTQEKKILNSLVNKPSIFVKMSETDAVQDAVAAIISAIKPAAVW